jgi:large subunit ribosomal protein L4
MAVIDVVNTKGETISQLDLPEGIFNIQVKRGVLHEVVNMQLAARRAGTASVKRRGDVRGSTRKLFRQKGTGRARRGDIKAPLLRGGGVVFGPGPRSYKLNVPKKVRKLALRMALSAKFQSQEITVLDNLEMPEIKTKDFASMMKSIEAENALVMIEAKDEKIEKSARNLAKVQVLRTDGLNVYDILKYKKLVLTEGAVKAIEGRLSA